MALAGAVDMLSWIRLYWAWLCDQRCDWRRADETLMKLPPAFSALTAEAPDQNHMPDAVSQVMKTIPSENFAIITTDCKSLFDHARNFVPYCKQN